MIIVTDIKETLKNIMKDNNLNIKDVSIKAKISTTSIRDFLKNELDVKYANLGSYNYCKLKKFFNIYNYDFDLNKANFNKLYRHGICDIKNLYDKNGKQLKVYETWKGMFRRCYSEKYHNREDTYKDCEVCEEWFLFSNFKKWYDDNYYQIDDCIMNLDKDILHKGNKIYSPNTCVFVNQIINNLFTKNDKIRGDLPIGVRHSSCCNKKYHSVLSYYNFDLKKKCDKSLGYSDYIDELFKKYKQAKEENIKRVADYYKYKIPKKLYDAMYRYEVEITD